MKENTYAVRAQATDYTYHVAGKTRQEAEDALRKHIEKRIQKLDDSGLSTERESIKGLSTQVEVEDKVDGVSPKINTDGERIT